MAGLKSRLLDATAFNFLESVWLKFFGLVSFAAVVRLLPRSDIGLIGVVAGYLAFLHPLTLSPHTIVLRDFEKMKEKLSESISSYLAFWGIRTIIVMVVAVASSVALWHWKQNFALSAYLVGAALVLNLSLLQGMAADLLYVSFRQRKITQITFCSNVALLLMIGLLLAYPNVLAYLAILIAWNALSAAWWWKELSKAISFQFQLPKQWLRNAWNSMTELSFWNHWKASAMELIYRSDLVILALFASATAVGNYAIALTIGNAFVLIPRIIQKSTILGLTRLEDRKGVEELVSVMFKNSVLLAVAQLVGFAILGRWLIGLLTDDGIEEIFGLTMVIGLGVSAYNVFRPFDALNFSKTSVRESFWKAYLPTAIASIALYYGFTRFLGVTGTALANMASYAMLSVLLIAFTWKTYPMKLRWVWLSEKERQLVSEYWEKVYQKADSIKKG